MILRSNGQRFPNWLEKNLLKLLAWLHRRLSVTVRLDDKGHQSLYRCDTVLDAARPMSLWVKEAGTMRWLDTELRAGDVFLDIGANIGIYSIAAAHRVGAKGKVYAFEPHAANAVTLLQNLQLSALSDRVSVLTCPLSDRAGAASFNYLSLRSSSSGSQFGHSKAPGEDRDFAPVVIEIKLATTVDDLIANKTIVTPSHVKIDVDGNELNILKGMRKLLVDKNRPRSVQVELNVGVQDAIVTFLKEHSYDLAARHHTAIGQKLSAQGVELENIAHNAIFRPSKIMRRPDRAANRQAPRPRRTIARAAPSAR